MSADLAAKERQFVASLPEDTGRDLDGWMQAIAGSGFATRNDIIDWLRGQGFLFARASWLERIHHNGGKLIYGEEGPTAAPPQEPAKPQRQTERVVENAAADAAAASAKTPAAAATTEAAPAKPAAAAPPAPAQQPSAAVLVADEAVLAALNQAKGLRPLAELILREVLSVCPGVTLSCDGPMIYMTGTQAFAALLLAPSKLKLLADFGMAAAGHSKPAVLSGKVPAPFPHMLVLDDARKIDTTFRMLIRAASAQQVTLRRA